MIAHCLKVTGSSSFGAAAEEIEDEDAEIDAVETVSEAETVAAEVNSADESTTSGAFSGGEGMVAEAIRLSSIERIVDGHTTVGVVTSAMRAVETTPITITSSGGTAQGGLSGSGSHVDPSLLDSSPSTRQYVRRARRGSLVSTDSERTASVTVRESETAPAAVGEVPGSEEVSVHIPEVPEGNIFVESISIDENLVIDVDFNADMAHVEPAEVAASEEPVQADVTPDSEDNMAGAQAADMEVTAPVAAQTSPTKTAGSGNETVAEEERRLQTAAVESAIRGQPGLLSAASSRHAEYFWIFDDVKVEFHGFRVPQGGVRFLEALWKKYGSCSAYLKLGVYIKGSMLTLLCLKRIVAGVTAAAYGVVAEAADDVVVKVADEVIAEIVENASNMQEVPAVNDVIVLGIIPKQDSQNRRGDSPQDRDYDPEGDDLAFVIRKCFLDSPVVLFPFLFEQVCYVRHCHKASFSLSCLIASASSLWFCCKLCISSSSRFVGGASGFGSLGGGGGGFCALTADSAWECSMWAETSLCFLLCRGLGGMALELYLSSWKC
uniref:Uncharacterized protein n=1 Tax=Fagus sylvatica TaxID=28930 RepID=A0A2N9HSM3_FAGSY